MKPPHHLKIRPQLTGSFRENLRFKHRSSLLYKWRVVPILVKVCLSMIQVTHACRCLPDPWCQKLRDHSIWVGLQSMRTQEKSERLHTPRGANTHPGNGQLVRRRCTIENQFDLYRRTS